MPAVKRTVLKPNCDQPNTRTTANSATEGSDSQPISTGCGMGSPGTKRLMMPLTQPTNQLTKPTVELSICFQIRVTPMTPATAGTKKIVRKALVPR